MKQGGEGARRGRRRAQGGAGMIEVMVAIVTLALGILAVAGMQAGGLRASHGAHYRAQAAFIAQDMIERMRGNPGEAKSYALNFGDLPPTGTTVIDRDKSQWIGALGALPGGAGEVQVDPLNNLVRVTVQWDNSRAGGAQPETFVLSSRVWSN
jgi:type IV pilus assembly protein PilV